MSSAKKLKGQATFNFFTTPIKNRGTVFRCLFNSAFLMKMQFTFNLMMKQSLSIGPDEAVTAQILEDFHTFMKGFVSLPIYIPGTSYHKAVKVPTLQHPVLDKINILLFKCRSVSNLCFGWLVSSG